MSGSRLIAKMVGQAVFRVRPHIGAQLMWRHFEIHGAAQGQHAFARNAVDIPEPDSLPADAENAAHRFAAARLFDQFPVLFNCVHRAIVKKNFSFVQVFLCRLWQVNLSCLRR